MSKAADLKPLTSLRFFAAMMIVFLHANELFDWKWVMQAQFPLKHGVSFFFVLSGFILTHVYSQRPDVSYGNFIWTRFARLWPTHVVTLLLLVLSVPEGWTTFYGEGMFSKWVTLASNLTLTQSLFPYIAYIFSWNAVSWSISTEFFFYLAFPFLLINFKRTWYIKILTSILPIFLLIMFGPLLGIPAETTEINKAATSLITNTNPLIRGFEFQLGMSAWILWSGLSKHLRRESAASIYEIGAILVSIVWFWYIYNQVVVPFANTKQVFGPWLTFAGSSWVFAILIISLAQGSGLIGKLLSARLFVWLGEISFAIYMVHQVLLKIFVTRLPEWTHDVVYFFVLIALSAVIHHFVEKPAKDWLLRLGKTITSLRSQSSSTS